MNVLIIEDEPTDLKLVSSILPAEDSLIATSNSADAALPTLARDRPHLILTGLNLPRMDGVTFTKRSKEMASTADIPVVALSAYPDYLPNTNARRAAGFAPLIVKPIDPQSFTALLIATRERL